MTPEQLQRLIIATFRKTRRRMNSLAWRRAIEVLTPQLRREAGLMAGQVQGECLRLEVAAPGQLAAAVAANGPALLLAAQRVERALEREKAVASLITASAILVALAMRVTPSPAPRSAGARATQTAERRKRAPSPKRATARGGPRRR